MRFCCIMVTSVALAIVIEAQGADYTSAKSGGYPVGSTWVGGFAPPNGVAHNVTISAGHTVRVTGNNQAGAHTITIENGSTLDYTNGQNYAFSGSTIVLSGGTFLLHRANDEGTGGGTSLVMDGGGTIKTLTDGNEQVYGWNGSDGMFDGGDSLVFDFNTSQSIDFPGMAVNGASNTITFTGDGSVSGVNLGGLSGSGDLEFKGPSALANGIYRITGSCTGFAGSIVVSHGIMELNDTPCFNGTDTPVTVDGATLRHNPSGANNTSGGAFSGMKITLTNGGKVDLTTNQPGDKNVRRSGDFLIQGTGTMRTTDTGGGSSGVIVDSVTINDNSVVTFETSAGDIEFFVLELNAFGGSNTLDFTNGPADTLVDNMNVYAPGTLTVNDRAAGEFIMQDYMAPRLRGHVDLLSAKTFTMLAADAGGDSLTDNTAFDNSGLWTQGGDMDGTINAGSNVTATLTNKVGELRADGDSVTFPAEDAGYVMFTRLTTREHTFQLSVTNLTTNITAIARTLMQNPKIVDARSVDDSTVEFDYVCDFKGTGYLAWDNHALYAEETVLGADVIGVASAPVGTVIWVR